MQAQVALLLTIAFPLHMHLNYIHTCYFPVLKAINTEYNEQTTDATWAELRLFADCEMCEGS